MPPLSLDTLSINDYPLRITSYPYPSAPPATVPIKPKKQEDIIPLSTIRTLCTNDYKALLKSKRVQVFFLTTYQGRLRGAPGQDSTNGWYVVSVITRDFS